MCGIVAQLGADVTKKSMMRGLHALAYRGYDSAGIAWQANDGTLRVSKTVGAVADLAEKLVKQTVETTVAIAHTRWATHGAASLENAHPHLSTDGRVAVVHNGVLEQCDALRIRLAGQGHTISSATDSELIAHLLSDLLVEHNNDLRGAFHALQQQIYGSCAVAALSSLLPNTLGFIRRGSPLLIGYRPSGIVLASDQAAFDNEVTRVVVVPDNSFGVIQSGKVTLFDETNTPHAFTPAARIGDPGQVSKGRFAHYMLKEIYEQPAVLAATVTQVAQQQIQWPQRLRRIHMVAAGSSWHAALIARFFFEHIAQVEVTVHVASEFVYAPLFPDQQAVYLFISQSGETADTLKALRRVLKHTLPTMGLTNVATSSLAREVDEVLVMAAGPEVSVASTKAFSCQLAALYVLAQQLAGAPVDQSLTEAITVLAQSLPRFEQIMRTEYAPRYAPAEKMIFLGRHIAYPLALEASLKLKEISYIFAQSYPAGELKHGPLALIDNTVPVVLFSSLDQVLYQKILVNAQEVVARNGRLLVFAFEGQHELAALAEVSFLLPHVAPLLAPLALTGILQLFAYCIANHRQYAIDMPRNLAKSVTVE